jgi:hypothetical protein
MTIKVRPQGIGNWSVKDIDRDVIIVDQDGFIPFNIKYLNVGNFIQPEQTLTSGLQEALTYQYQYGDAIFINSGNYNIYSQINTHANAKIFGSGNNGTILTLANNLGTNDVFNFDINGVYRVQFEDMSFHGGGKTANSWINFSTAPEGSYHNYLKNLIFGENNSDANFTWDIILDHMEDTVATDIEALGLGISWQVNGGSGELRGGKTTNLLLAAQNFVLDRIAIFNKITLAGTTVPSTYLFNGVYFNNPTTSPIIIDSTALQVIVDNNSWWNDNQNNGTPYPLFSRQSASGTVRMISNGSFFGDINIGSGGFVSYPMFASGITGTAQLNNAIVYGGFPGAFTDWRNWLSEMRATGGFSITTPAVPASGTALTNTNGTWVNIIITATGTVTAFSITDQYGNSQTISTSLRAGQNIVLPPGGKITLTYTAAPSWVWMSI